MQDQRFMPGAESRRGPLPAFMQPLTIPASWVYGLGVATRNRRYDRGLGVQRVPLPVISIGNLSAGGAGKTPMTAWVCRQLMGSGHRPMIAMRGYGARVNGMSDEQAELTERLPSVPIVVGADRAAAITEVLPDRLLPGREPATAFDGRWPEVDCVVLDDGFQHRQLARDLDVVLIDASRGTLDDRLLPAGFLREPPGNLRRADSVVVTRADGVSESLAESIRRHHGREPIAWTRHEWTGLMIMSQAPAAEPVSWLKGRRVVSLLGVGNPASVRKQVQQAGAVIVRDIPAADHQRYDAAVIDRIRSRSANVDAVLTTPKDWVKLRDLIDPETWPCPIVVPRLAIRFLQGEEAFGRLVLDAVARPGC